ncbi:BgTH12-00558 [Blumeria graminis f. sp. triticale]|uniref:BgTH12-00558 n=1 Tax=Blumeria graminis f. sp. triticale TaxID=1689686 RepID=A0A9W4GGW6_BLUGR|nr:BgTH12-00558 [Blumeria graminis f. sp. triticale]
MAADRKTLRIPKTIHDQILRDSGLTTVQQKFQSNPGTRKQNRKAARDQKKGLKRGPPPQKRQKLNRTSTPEIYQVSPQVSDSSSVNSQSLRGDRKPQLLSTISSKCSSSSRTTHEDKSEENDKLLSAPTPVVSRAALEKLAQDDDEIAALEKKLGLKKSKKLPRSFEDDGLDILLGDLDNIEDLVPEKKKAVDFESEKWLKRKRKEALVFKETNDSMYQNQNHGEEDLHSSTSQNGHRPVDKGLITTNHSSLSQDESFSGFESDDISPSIPISQGDLQSTQHTSNVKQKYVPPSLRASNSSHTEDLLLKRRIQGLINRLTETNLQAILWEIEKLYQQNARHNVTSVLVNILLVSVCEPTNLPDTLIILCAGFITAVYKVIGTDFGAEIVQQIVELFDKHYTHACALKSNPIVNSRVDFTKESSNLITLLAQMYNFHVLGSNLVFDYIRFLLEELSELNAELLLKVIRTSGPQLRQDDPSSLKDVVVTLKSVAARVGEKNITVRTKFMMETIDDLKNNRMKTGGVASAVTSEHNIRMKKILGSLNNRTVKASEPLRISLKDIQDSDKRGKWWLVGASWSGPVKEESKKTDDLKIISHDRDPGALDFSQLAREQRMNTDIRRAIFVSIMSATDYEDAHVRLMKLKLKKIQEYEIPKVLIRCALSESSHNPYYTLLAKKICGEKRLRMSFQYCLWDLFKRMEESEDDDKSERDEEELDMRRLVTLAKLYGALIAEGSLSLSILKPLNLDYFQPKMKIFVEILFITIFLRTQTLEMKVEEKTIANILSKVPDTPRLLMGLQGFLKKVVYNTDIAGGKQASETIKLACKYATATIKKMLDQKA